MRVELKGFQQLAADELARHVRLAQRDALDDRQAVVLSAPTGAGKTVIATALVERLIEGDESADANPEATFLWLTDQPELNEQTRRKMLEHSSLLGADRLTVVDPAFDAETFTPGRVHFLNIQKLGRNSTFVRRGDDRAWTLWETIAHTIERRPRSFVLIIDEAHRGMAETAQERKRAQTIVQKFVKGSEGETPPVPVVVGISATPERFLDLLTGVQRTVRPPVDVAPEEVRASGLLKETLLVFHPEEEQPSDMTLLRTAAERLRDYEAAWAEYHDQGGNDKAVLPALVVQVQDRPGASSAGVSATELDRALAEIEDVIGPLDDAHVGHAFQEGADVTVGKGRSIRYVAPPDVQGDPNLRVVFFKTSLNTGWDCPRAEVMMSFRKAADHTLIAQLVGRMVRTPLARRVDTDEFLNTVSLYLPHYDRVGLEKILHRLQEDDPDFLPPIQVARGSERVRLTRDPKLDRCFEALEQVPTYDVAAVRKTSNVRRAMKLSRLLARDDIAPDALDETRASIVGFMEEARETLASSDRWTSIVNDTGTIDLRAVEWAIGAGTVAEQRTQVAATSENVEDLFRAAGRRLGEGLHKAYWRRRAEADRGDPSVHRTAKLEAFALTQHGETMRELESAAGERIATLFADAGRAIDRLPADRRDSYHQVRLTARDPEPRLMALPEHIEGRAIGRFWDRHLYVDEGGRFVYDFRSSWEERVLEIESERVGFLGWLRNEDRKDWALSVPYRWGSETRPLYPDLIIFRRVASDVVVDVLDPHDPGRDDWVPKVRGLAEYAAKHWQCFGRIEAIFLEGERVRRLDLCVESNRARALAAEGPGHLKSLFGG